MTAFGQDRTPREHVRDRRNSQRWRLSNLILDPDGGLTLDNEGRIGILLADDSLLVSASGLQVQVKSGSGLAVDSDGLNGDDLLMLALSSYGH